MKITKGLSCLIFLSFILSCEESPKAEKNEFIKTEFLNSPEYSEYLESEKLFAQVLVPLVIDETGQKITANNPGEAKAIKEFVKRELKLNIKPQVIGKIILQKE